MTFTHSPDPARRDMAATKSAPSLALLLLAGLPLLVWAVNEEGAARALALFVCCLLVAAARLITRGQRLERAFAVTGGARRIRLPRKMIGSCLLGCAVMLLAMSRFESMLLCVFLGLTGLALAVMAFGVDPGLRLGRRANPVRDHALLTDLETALTSTELRLAALQEGALHQQATAFGDHAIALLHRTAGRDRRRLSALQPVIARTIGTLDAETARLEYSDRSLLARRRYAAQIALLREGLDTSIAAVLDSAAAADAPAPMVRARQASNDMLRDNCAA